MSRRSLLLDLHTHIYTPRLITLLRSRSTNPRIISSSSSSNDEKLLILPDEPPSAGGRPLGPQYWSRSSKLAFMDRHRIDVSVVSLANPWLDWMSEPEEAVRAAQEANEDLVAYCSSQEGSSDDEAQLGSAFSPGDARHNFASPIPNRQRLKAFGVLPFADNVPISALTASLDQICHLARSGNPNNGTGPAVLCGAILGTRGIGRGLDDPRLEPFWEKVEKEGLTLFLHPHNGVGAKEASEPGGLFGKRDNGHVLPLALGFPYETAASTVRLILAGVLDRYPNLKLMLAHSGGALPLLSSRLASCVAHDPHLSSRLQHDVRYYLGKLYYDAVSYGPEELCAVCAIVGRAERFKRGGQGIGAGPRSLEEASAEVKKGAKRFHFGTDHPFFPPLADAKENRETSGEQMPWASVMENIVSINAVPGWGQEERQGIMSGNAQRLLDLNLSV